MISKSARFLLFFSFFFLLPVYGQDSKLILNIKFGYGINSDYREIKSFDFFNYDHFSLGAEYKRNRYNIGTFFPWVFNQNWEYTVVKNRPGWSLEYSRLLSQNERLYEPYFNILFQQSIYESHTMDFSNGTILSKSEINSLFNNLAIGFINEFNFCKTKIPSFYLAIGLSCVVVYSKDKKTNYNYTSSNANDYYLTTKTYSWTKSSFPRVNIEAGLRFNLKAKSISANK